ncbi:SPOR domain-containing protein [Rhodoferax sp.]|uniref:SPOR domain-containing protein n=1 Tax=Rhodoferax sp. TaxID=50421 RepID=UPI0028428A05|nr:SPOR domain-containing protein [Rhodoferax sp.]MDR3371532.1 SPOR domain-containing protein [Rhodoferax sp.]
MPEPANRAEDTVKLDASPTMAMTTLYGAAIGPIGSDYYLPLFERFEAAGRGTLSWNWSACLYNLNWMFFRGLWGAALVAAGALTGTALVLIALGHLVFNWPPELLYGLLLACLALVFLVPGAWGNALLYNHSRSAMMTAVANNKTLVQACAELSQHASSRLRFIRILVINLTLIALASLTYVMLSDNNAPVSPKPYAAPALVSASRPAIAAQPTASKAEPAASATELPASGVTSVASSPVKAAFLAPSTAASASAAPQALLATSAPAQASSQAVSAPAMTAIKEVKAPPPTPQIKAKLPVSAPAPAEGFYVNAGLFANPDNAHRTLTQLKAAGLPATAQELESSQGPRTRVRVGPFTKRARAAAAIKQIKALNLDAALAKP